MDTFSQRLAARLPQIGLCVMYSAPGVIERIGQDWDFVWVDGQHGELDYNDILNLVRACDLVGVPALVRVPWLEAGVIGKMLDTAAAGVIVPCVDCVEAAQAAVMAAKFPPLGNRSYGGRRVIDRHGRGYSETSNQDQLLIVQIESPAAVEAADAIAAVDGVDALMIGPDDLLLRQGLSMMAPRSPQILEKNVQSVAEAARRNGKLAMGVGVGTAMFQLHHACGYSLIVAGGDVSFLASGSKAAADEARGMLEAVDAPGASVGKVSGTSPY